MDEVEALRLFNAWFVVPLNMMRPNNDGGFIAFITALALYERLTIAKLKLKDQPMDEISIKQTMASDLGLSQKEQSVFWGMFRNGLLHQAMPMSGKTGYMFHTSFSDSPIFKEYLDSPIVCIDPWKFTDRVLKEFLDDPSLIIASESFPLPFVTPIDFEKLKDLSNNL